MCGISFYCIQSEHQQSALEESLQNIQHRGPDASGAFFTTLGDYHIGLGHNRLSIIDLSPAGTQPMHALEGKLSISYNGEIYNFKQLRRDLEEQGVCFQTNTDTEVILQMYACHGTAAFSQLRGMYAFVLLDMRTQQLFVVRDMVGIKPIYLYETEQGLFGCSEIKGLKPFSGIDLKIDRSDIFEFFTHGFLYEPNTGYQGVKKLMPGHMLTFDLRKRQQSITPYASLDHYQNPKPLETKIQEAVKRQTVSDVPLGTLFSGGVDSSLLAEATSDPELFFARYESDPVSDIDLQYSQKIATHLGKQLKVADLSSEDKSREALLASVDFVTLYSEELISDYTFWSTYQLSKAARDSGYRVMLSGMGGDEAFAGYPRYLVLKYHGVLRKLRFILKFLLKNKLFPRSLDKKFERLVSYSYEKNWYLAYSRMLGYFNRQELDHLFHDAEELEEVMCHKLKQIPGSAVKNTKDKIKVAQWMDAKGFLSHNLLVSDKASMLASIELRVPLLDEAVIADGYQMPSRQLLKGNQPKHPLKSLLRRILPKELVERPETGFNPPLDGLIHRLGSEELKKQLKHTHQLIDTSIVESMIDDHFSGKSNHTYKLWQLLYFCRWVKMQEIAV